MPETATLVSTPLSIADRLKELARRHPGCLRVVRDVSSPRHLLDLMESSRPAGYQVFRIDDAALVVCAGELLEQGYEVTLLPCGIGRVMILGHTHATARRLRQAPLPSRRGPLRLRWLTLIAWFLAMLRS